MSKFDTKKRIIVAFCPFSDLLEYLKRTMGNAASSEASYGDAPRKHVAIIGGGSSGIILMKELQEAGHTFECFEMLPTIGGVYVKSYESAVLTTSLSHCGGVRVRECCGGVWVRVMVRVTVCISDVLTTSLSPCAF